MNLNNILTLNFQSIAVFLAIG